MLDMSILVRRRLPPPQFFTTVICSTVTPRRPSLVSSQIVTMSGVPGSPGPQHAAHSD